MLLLAAYSEVCVTICEDWKELAHVTVRRQLILFSKITGEFCSEHLVDFSIDLLHRFTASLVP
jgi:hypothetical protein